MSTNSDKRGQKQQEIVIACSDSLDFTDEKDEELLKETKRRRAKKSALAFCHCMNVGNHAIKGPSGTPLLVGAPGRAIKQNRGSYISSRNKSFGQGERHFVNKEDDVGSDIENEIPLALASISEFSRSSWVTMD